MSRRNLLTFHIFQKPRSIPLAHLKNSSFAKTVQTFLRFVFFSVVSNSFKWFAMNSRSTSQENRKLCTSGGHLSLQLGQWNNLQKLYRTRKIGRLNNNIFSDKLFWNFYILACKMDVFWRVGLQRIQGFYRNVVGFSFVCIGFNFFTGKQLLIYSRKYHNMNTSSN